MELTSWKVAMLALTPFMRGNQMLRTWAAVFGASVATYFFQGVPAFIAIDAIAAALVIARPSGLAQKSIGALFVCMLLFDLGFYLSPQENVDLFRAVLTGIGWFQWLILLGWTGHDCWRRYRSWSDAPYSPPAAYQGPVR